MAGRVKERGFSLIELMVSLAAGLIVVGAVVAFALASVQANSEYVSSTRLTQELRTSLDTVTDDLRRAGYDENALFYVARPATFTGASPFSKVFVSSTGDCVIYAYDRTGGVAGTLDLGNGEVRGVRRATRTVNGQTVGVLEFAESSGTIQPACDGAAPSYASLPYACSSNGWCPLSDPGIVNVTAFQLVNDRPLSAGVPGLIAGAAGSAVLPMQLRKYQVRISGQLVGTPTITRTLATDVRVRSDCVRAAAATNCVAAPNGT